MLCIRFLGKTLAAALLAQAVFLGGACSSGEPAQQPPTGAGLQVMVSILPQAYFAGRIGGEQVSVEVLVRPGQSPETYEITPRQMEQLAAADVYFAIGVPFEAPLLPKIAANCPNLRVVDTRQGVPLRTMAAHAHPGEGGAVHGTDPHVWLDPARVKLMARTIASTFSALAPEHAGLFEANLVAFQADLDAADAKIRAILDPHRGKTLYVFHPAYGYFAEAYGLQQVAVEEEGKGPAARHLHDLIDVMKAERATALFAQPQYSLRQAQAMAEAAGVVVVELDPLAEDYLANLALMATRIAQTLEQEAPFDGRRGRD